MSSFLAPVRTVGRGVLQSVSSVGRAGYLGADAARALKKLDLWGPHLLPQMGRIGVESVPIALFIASFTGMVLALQASYTFTGQVPLYFVGALVGKTMILELGPVLTGLSLSGRVGANIAAEIGTMRVTEQIDAMAVMAVNPVQYLVTPRVFAAVLMMPILVTLFNYVGIVAAYLLSVHTLGIDPGMFVAYVKDFVESYDLLMSALKGACFGMAIAVIACYKGFYTTGGATGVGRATTSAVVVSSVAILVSNYFIAVLV